MGDKLGKWDRRFLGLAAHVAKCRNRKKTDNKKYKLEIIKK